MRILILVLILNSYCLRILAQDNYKNYLNKACCNLLDEKDSSGILSYKNDSAYKLFLAGEDHFKKHNKTVKTQFLLFKNLYYTNNVRVIIEEGGYCKCVLLNKYIETGDEHLLWQIEDYPVDQHFYKNLYKMYKDLPSTEKFTVYGVDYDRKIAHILMALHLLIQEKPDTSLTNLYDAYIIKDMNLINAHTYKELREILVDIMAESKEYEKEYKEYFKDSYEDFLQILRSIEGYLKYNKKPTVESEAEREIFIYKNILNMPDSLLKKNIFGQFGSLHILLEEQPDLSRFGDYSSFARFLNESDSSTFKNKVYSICIVTKPNIFGDKSQKAIFNKNEIIKYLYSIKKKSIYLLRLDLKDTPYSDFIKNKFQSIIYIN